MLSRPCLQKLIYMIIWRPTSRYVIHSSYWFLFSIICLRMNNLQKILRSLFSKVQRTWWRTAISNWFVLQSLMNSASKIFMTASCSLKVFSCISLTSTQRVGFVIENTCSMLFTPYMKTSFQKLFNMLWSRDTFWMKTSRSKSPSWWVSIGRRSLKLYLWRSL